MSARFTPGPWTLGEPNAVDRDSSVVAGVHSADWIIADVWKDFEKSADDPDGEEPGTGLANAQLIAAAPDYWDAAERLSTDHSELDGDDAGYVAVPKDAFDALMAAHHKASGK